MTTPVLRVEVRGGEIIVTLPSTSRNMHTRFSSSRRVPANSFCSSSEFVRQLLVRVVPVTYGLVLLIVNAAPPCGLLLQPSHVRRARLMRPREIVVEPLGMIWAEPSFPPTQFLLREDSDVLGASQESGDGVG